MKIRSLVAIAALFLVIVIGVIISINGCGKSLVGSTATSSQQAQTALDKGDYTTAVSEATKTIDNPSSTADEKADAYTVVGQAKLGEVLTSKNTTTAKVITSIADNSTSKGENLSAIAPDLIMKPEFELISSSLINLSEITKPTTQESILNYIKALIVKVTRKIDNKETDYYAKAGIDLKKLGESLDASEKIWGTLAERVLDPNDPNLRDETYWNSLNRDQQKELLQTRLIVDVALITSVINQYFSEDGETPIVDSTQIHHLVKSSTEEVKQRWFKVNHIKNRENSDWKDISTATTSGEVAGRFRDARPGVTWLVDDIYDILHKQYTGSGEFVFGTDSNANKLREDSEKLVQNLISFNGRYFNTGKSDYHEPDYSELEKYIFKNK